LAQARCASARWGRVTLRRCCAHPAFRKRIEVILVRRAPAPLSPSPDVVVCSGLVVVIYDAAAGISDIETEWNLRGGRGLARSGPAQTKDRTRRPPAVPGESGGFHST
jgi:hypothetical protein